MSRLMRHEMKGFVVVNDLHVGDFLVFRHQGNLCFQVLVFDSSTSCEREIPPLQSADEATKDDQLTTGLGEEGEEVHCVGDHGVVGSFEDVVTSSVRIAGFKEIGKKKDVEEEMEVEIAKDNEVTKEKEGPKVVENSTDENPNVGVVNEDEVFDDGLDPLFTKAKSNEKITELFGDDLDENDPPVSKLAPNKRKSGSNSKDPKKPRYPRKKGVVVEDILDKDDEVGEEVPLNTLNICTGMLNYCTFHSGRRYTKSWYDTSPAFKFFKDAVIVQKWMNLLDKYCPVYLSEVIQFYATVKVDVASGTLSAIINDKPFVLTIDQLANYLNVPKAGLATYPEGGWGEDDHLTYPEVMETLRPKEKFGVTYIYAFELHAPHRFLFNLIIRALLPSNNYRGRCSRLEMLLLYHLIKHIPINLPSLMFHRIHQMSTQFQNARFDRNAVVPYATWLSIIFAKEKLIAKGSPEVEKLSDEMGPDLLSKMFMEISNGKLVRLHRGKAKVVATTGSNVDLGPINAKLNKLMVDVAQLANDSVKLREEIGELKSMNKDLIKLMQALGGR